ncbi:MAG: DUF1080 domain-containing protein [Fuerstiella sp.]
MLSRTLAGRIVATLSLLSVLYGTSSVVVAQDKKDADTKSTKASAKADPAAPAKNRKGGSSSQKDGWQPLFNGKDLSGWKVTNFGGEGEVYIEDGLVVITQGVDLSGITSTRKDLPKVNYEIEFEAQRAEGSDFFVGMTFPVGESACSLICGGWGGGVCGLSSLDGMDASENETTGYMAFTNGQWYKVRIRVTEDRIKAWLDKHELADVETKDRRIDVRFEVDLSKPMGFATYQSTAKIRNARLRRLPADDSKGGQKATK